MADEKLRKDAELNRQRLLTAGREVFASRGLDATLNDVAHHAGVGVGTAYRRFSNKEELIEAIFEQQVDELENILHDALAAPDAWEGLVDYFERSIAVQVNDRGLAQVLSGRWMPKERSDWSRDKLAPLVNQLVERAQEQGKVRADVVGTDLIFAEIGIIAISEAAHDNSTSTEKTPEEQVYRRHLWLYLDSLRSDRSRELVLPAPALSTEETHRRLTDS
ncbi:TetR/AcrR family transcriptional regulator [Corynebacterium lubricantis]|uniref:TetR/AcrR family transcriptional regulator n=1 Tax=Corynebacterium lubricantis TaxID=541095 RepID=UPI00035E6230|nr:TetR/AcrR family transcriptional regulator [Corynebacterium lubricantis]